MRELSNLAYYALWYLKCRLLRRRIPLLSGFNITSRCNLRCKHCWVIRRNEPLDMKHFQVVELMKHFYRMGSRIVFFQGGEPLLWNEDGYTVNDLIQESKNIGFFKSCLVTNGTLPINTNADLVWVSIDGTREVHDEIRGKGCFDRVMENVENSSHPRIYANMTINALNKGEVEAVVKMIARNKSFKGISINFHIPHIGVEDLFVPFDQRQEVLEVIIALKKNSFPILNSIGGLEAMQLNKWKRRCWIAHLVEPDGRIFEGCPGGEEDVCKECGYGVMPEMSLIFEGRFSCIREAVNLFIKRAS
jgi:MoaA/NifB/PqqE/SkfB family radical SAM enzyme